MTNPLFQPFDLGELRLANRVVMAPLTRSRAAPGLVPSPLAPLYYSQRASAGLIVAEATQVSADAQGYQDTPGLYTPEQIAGWRQVTEAVHAAGGRIFVQLWHVGRVSHVDLRGGEPPVAPSAIAAATRTFVNNVLVPTSTPRALELAEIPGIVDSFRRAAAAALAAGFDGVEIHGANGYLLDQFARDGANHRDDAYGGAIENRARLMLEVAGAVAAEIGAGRTGIRISPVSPANGMTDSDPQPLFNHIVEGLDALRLVYLHVVEGATGGPRDIAPFDFAALRQRFRGAWIGNNGYDLDLATRALAEGRVDLVAFGRPFIANPDLVRRLESGAALAAPDNATFYGGGAAGYTDYPALTTAA